MDYLPQLVLLVELKRKEILLFKNISSHLLGDFHQQQPKLLYLLKSLIHCY
jgi:hypothetical protein